MLNEYGVDCTGWVVIHPKATVDMLGLVPMFLLDNDPRPAREQFDERYHFGGWRPISGFEMWENEFIKFPEDPELPPLLERKLRDERIVMYPNALFAIIQPDGSFEIARMD